MNCDSRCTECDKIAFEFCNIEPLSRFNNCEGIFNECIQSNECEQSKECEYMNRD